MNKLLLSLILLVFMAVSTGELSSCSHASSPAGQADVNTAGPDSSNPTPVLQCGADQMGLYLPELKGKRVALMVNQTSLIGRTHLVDTLLSRGVNIVKIFSPEHGFRGTADAGEVVKSNVDSLTGLPVVSLYGKNKKPTKEQLSDVDLVIFDIQDIGVRFFTYIGSLHYLMQGCAESNKPLLILDRPNPNGYYIDGPILKMEFKSFIGMHPVPVVHGMTVGEYAQMINGEKWLDSGKVCTIKIIPCTAYTHKTRYVCPVKLSPNMRTANAIQYYPTICLFEGTVMSVGRGTEWPFEVVGAPNKAYGEFSFTPISRPGAKTPPHMDQLCYGIDFRKAPAEPGFTLSYVMQMYERSPEKDKFFTDFFTTLIGNKETVTQIKAGKSESEIRMGWKTGIEAFKAKRKKYLLYTDFE